MDLGALQQQFTDFINSDAVQLFFRASASAAAAAFLAVSLPIDMPYGLGNWATA